ncbi:MAG TPA: AsmA family protein [Dongiaceae bacterium]|nr:AsmA family protein [Dongiaceae bacterium]
MRKGVKIAAGVVAAVIVIALVAPMFVPLNSYKGLIAEKAKAATGRDLTIDGDISLSLLPMPSVSVAGIKFGNAAGGSTPDMATLDKARVKIALLPLLGGKIEISEIVLEKPVIVLEKLKDGSANWQIKPAGAPAASGAAAPASPPSAAPSTGMNIAVDGASIQDGTIIYRDATSGSEQKIENLNVDLTMDSLQGPFAASGGVTAVGMPLGFNVKLGRLDSTTPMPVDASLSVSEANATIAFKGTADPAAANDPQKTIVVGKLSGKGDSVAKILALLPGADKSAAQPPLLSQAFSIDGDVSAGSAAATVKDLALQLGDLSAKAAVAANYAKDVAVQANIAVGRIDLDKLLPAGGSSANQAAAAPASGAKPAASFSLPGGITAGADVTVQQIVMQGQPIDNTKLSLQLANSQLTIKSLTAQLPGATGLGASGVLYADQGQPAFTGGVNVNAGNLRGLIDAFAKGAVDSVPGDRLRSLALTSKIGFKNNQLDVTQLNGQLDQSTIQGSASIALPDGKARQQMGFGLGLAIDKLNLDGYLPKGKAPATASTASTDKASADNKAATANPLKSLAPFGNMNANIDAKIGSLTMNQQQVNGLHLLIASGGGVVDIKDLSVADFIGGKGTVSGKLSDLNANPHFDATYNVTAKEASNVMQMAGAGNAQAAKLGALTLNGKAGGTLDSVDYDTTIGIAGIGAQGSAKGTLAGLMNGGIPKVNTTFDLKARDAAALAAVAGASADAAKQLGAVSVTGSAQTSNTDLTYDVALSAAGIGADGKLAGKLSGISGDNPQVDTTLNLSAQKPAPLLQLVGLAGPKAQAAGALGVAGTLKGGADKMLLDLKLQGLGGTAAVSGTVRAKAKPIAFDIALTANHPQFSDLLRVADLPSSGVQAGPLKLAVKATGTTQKANLSQLDAAWGDSSLTGTGSYDATGAKPLVNASIVGGTINLIPFMGGANKPANGKSVPAAGGGGNGPWSTEPLDLSMLKQQDANIDLKAKSLIMPDQRIDDLVAKVTIRDGLMTMETLNGKIYGGGFDLSGTTVNGNGTPKVEAKMIVDKIQVGQVVGGGIAGNQLKGPLSLNLALGGSGNSQAELVRSLTGKGSLDGTMMIIGQVEQQVGSALIGVLGQKVKAVQGISETITGVLSNFTGVDNALKGTFNITKGVLDTQDFSFANPKARGTSKGQIDLTSLAFSPMLVDLFSGASDKAFMSINLQGPLSSPRPNFVSNGSAGASGILGVDPNGQVQPGLIQQIPGGNKLLNKLGVQPSTGTSAPAATGTTPSPAGTTDTTNGQTTAPATQSKPSVNIPGVGDIQLPFGKKKKKKNSDTTTDQQPTQ